MSSGPHQIGCFHGSRRSWVTRGTVGSLVALIVGGVACDGTLVQTEFLEPFTPPPVYRSWWNQVEWCTGVEGDFAEIRWFAGESLTMGGAEIFGLWAAPRTIVMERFYMTSAPAVKHEMLHHLTNGEVPHTHPAFTVCTAATDAPPDGG